MKPLLPLLPVLLTILLSSCSHQSGRRTAHPTYHYTVRVTKISDGDTFHGLREDSTDVRFRIYGIDAPERTQPFSNKSKQQLSDLIFGKQVGIVVQKKNDGWGRPVVWVYTPDGKDVSAEMLKAGMAWHFKRYDDTREYAELENTARKNRTGLWADDEPVAPWEFRGRKKK